jgi:hypothetical protein
MQRPLGISTGCQPLVEIGGSIRATSGAPSIGSTAPDPGDTSARLVQVFMFCIISELLVY